MRYSRRRRYSVMPSTSRPKAPPAIRPPTADEITQFTMAAQKGSDVSLVKDFIRRFPKHIDAQDRYEQTALMRAARYEDSGFEALKLLIENGADINLKCGKNWTALMPAIIEGSPKCGKLLIDNGLDLNRKRAGEKNFLMTAVNFSNIEVLEILINKGMDPFEKDDNGHDAFYYAESCSSKDIKEIMIELYESRNIKIDEDLYTLIESQDINAVREYFDEAFYEGKKIELSSRYLTPAIINEDVSMARLLLTRGVKFSKNDIRMLKKENEDKYPTYIKLLKRAGLRGLPKVSVAIKLKSKSEIKNAQALKPEIQQPEKKSMPDKPETFEDKIEALKEKIPKEWKDVLSSLSKESNSETIIGGGALRDLFNGRAIKDVDIFIKAKSYKVTDDKKDIREAFNSLGIETLEHKVKVHLGYSSPTVEFCSTDKVIINKGDEYGFGRKTLQSYVVTSKTSGAEYNIIFVDNSLVHGKGKAFAKNMINRFDLGICQIGFDGSEVIYTEAYREDIEGKIITLKTSHDSNKEHLKRVMKKYHEWDICNASKKMFPVKSIFSKKFRIKRKRCGTSSTGPK